MLTTVSPYINSDAPAYIIFQGTPNIQLSWSLVGSGSLVDASAYSDARGFATAKFVPSAPDQIVLIKCSYLQ